MDLTCNCAKVFFFSNYTEQKKNLFERERENERRRCERSRSWVQGDWLRPPLVKPLPAAAPPPLMLSSLKLHLSQKQLVFGALDTVGLCKQKEVSYSFWRRRCQNKHVVTYILLTSREVRCFCFERWNALWRLMGAHCAAARRDLLPLMHAIDKLFFDLKGSPHIPTSSPAETFAE